MMGIGAAGKRENAQNKLDRAVTLGSLRELGAQAGPNWQWARTGVRKFRLVVKRKELELQAHGELQDVDGVDCSNPANSQRT